MGNRVFVGNLPYSATSENLKEYFDSFGPVKDARIMTDRETGQSRGFGFVTFHDEQTARQVISDANRSVFMGRTMIVNEAHDKPRGAPQFQVPEGLPLDRMPFQGMSQDRPRNSPPQDRSRYSPSQENIYRKGSASKRHRRDEYDAD